MIDSYQISLKALLRNDHGQILALKAQSGETFEGFYDLPGGRIDVTEFTVPYTDILEREIKEEAGPISFIVHPRPVAIGRHLITAKPGLREEVIHIMYVFFEADYNGGDITISDEHADYKWLDIEEIELEKFFTSGILDGIRMYSVNK